MAQRLSNYPVVTDTQGKLTNPTTATVLADSGAITEAATGGGGIYEVLVVVAASATAFFQVEHRNGANSSTLDDLVFIVCPANSTVSVPLRYALGYDTGGNGERVRVMCQTNLTGDAYVSLQIQRVA